MNTRHLDPGGAWAYRRLDLRLCPVGWLPVANWKQRDLECLFLAASGPWDNAQPSGDALAPNIWRYLEVYHLLSFLVLLSLVLVHPPCLRFTLWRYFLSVLSCHSMAFLLLAGSAQRWRHVWTGSDTRMDYESSHLRRMNRANDIALVLLSECPFLHPIASLFASIVSKHQPTFAENFLYSGQN